MYFVSHNSDTLGAQLATYARFYYEKFPAVFQSAEYENDEEEESEEEETQIEWVSEDAEKDFKNFEEKARAFVKKEDPSGFLTWLLTFKKYILQLPQSIKQAECTIQRFMLYLLPLYNLSYSQTPEIAMTLVEDFAKLMADAPEFTIQAKVTSFLHMYNTVQGAGMKALIFTLLIELTSKNGCFEILSQRAHVADQEAKAWGEMTVAERQMFYSRVATVLDKEGDDTGAFNLMHAHLRLFEKASEDELKEQENAVRRCIILAIKASTVINFEELQDLAAFKALQGSNQEVLDFFNLFTQTDAQLFTKSLDKFSALMKKEGITKDQALQKKSYLQICSLATLENSNFDYNQLAQLLAIKQEDVEDWAIEAIANKIIDARIDQLNERIIIKSTKLRQLKTEEWMRILGKVQIWKEKFERMQMVLAASTPGQLAQ